MVHQRILRLSAALLGFVATVRPAAAAPPWPAPRTPPVHLLASLNVITYAPNRTVDGFSSAGVFGIDTSGAGVAQGGFWPRGTRDNYIWQSGLELAGVIGGDRGSNPWAGDTVSAKCADLFGDQRHCEAVSDLLLSTSVDSADWPDLARVPAGDSAAALFDPSLQGQIAASDADAHLVVWDGDPAALGGRAHALGVVIDIRLLGWNHPVGNQDIIYVISTIYNISSVNAADYAAVRPAMRSLLIQKAADFQSMNDAQFGVTLPVGGYTISPLVPVWVADPDVGNTVNNYFSVNLAAGISYAWEARFSATGQGGAFFAPDPFGAPFFPGFGFVGFQFLNGTPAPHRIQLFTNYTGGGAIPDPNNAVRLFRIYSGQPTSSDGSCNISGAPAQTHVCYVQQVSFDILGGASEPGSELAPGASRSVVVAVVFAAPVAIPGFQATASTDVKPANPEWTESGDSIVTHGGLHTIDSLTGFLGYTGPAHDPDGSDHVPLLSEFRTVPRSLLGKAQLAQAVFDHHFLMPAPPAAPDFYLVPADSKVTILWKPSVTETTGDGYFAVAGLPTTMQPDGSVIPNALYDPDFRKFDVEGYRIYRGRTDSPGALELVRQFDYAGTAFSDYAGVVTDPGHRNCAPELGLSGSNCAANLSPVTPGVTSTVHVDYPLSQPLVQVVPGDRGTFAPGQVYDFSADTAVTGGASGDPPLSDTGVPFVFVDTAAACAACGVVDGSTYYYTVTAFDVNSLLSGPSSLESARILKSVDVGSVASNFAASASYTTAVIGRHGPLTDTLTPTIDSVTGEFSKPQPPGNGLTLSIPNLVAPILNGSGTITVRYDSTVLAGELRYTDYLTIVSGTTSSIIGVPYSMPEANDAPNSVHQAGGTFGAVPVDAASAARYGVTGSFLLAGAYTDARPIAYLTGLQTRGCVNGGLTGPNNGHCYFNGPRWFAGANEHTADPTIANPETFATFGANGTALPVEGAGNAGSLPGVVAVNHPDAYGWIASTWRTQEYIVAPFVTAADYQLYWGSGGAIDSVVDITHDVPVPFDPRTVNSWGVLDATTVAGPGSEDQRGDVLTVADFTCIAPIRDLAGTGCTQPADSLSRTAVPGQLAFTVGSLVNSQTATAEPYAGFGLYLKGRFFLFELQGGTLPVAGTVWTMRDYVGAIYGGHNAELGDDGPYAFYPAPVRPFNAPGAAVQLSWQASSVVAPPDASALASVHPVPDPYYFGGGAWTNAGGSLLITFVNVPVGATIRIYTSSGRLVRFLVNSTTATSGSVPWDVTDRNGKPVASGVYFYNVESTGHSHTGRMTIVDANN